MIWRRFDARSGRTSGRSGRSCRNAASRRTISPTATSRSFRGSRAERSSAPSGWNPIRPGGLLRSAAVLPAFRERGVGVLLVDALVREARERSISELVLLTTTAEKFFGRLGFSRIERGTLDGPILTSASVHGDDLFVGRRDEAGAGLTGGAGVRPVRAPREPPARSTPRPRVHQVPPAENQKAAREGIRPVPDEREPELERAAREHDEKRRRHREDQPDKGRTLPEREPATNAAAGKARR